MVDFKIQSKNVFRAVLLTQLAATTALLMAELLIDLKSGETALFVFNSILSVSLTLIGFYKSESKIVRFFVPFLIAIILESHFINQPESFKSVVFWFPFIPILALICQGLRASQAWFVLVIALHSFNFYYVKETIGGNYTIEIDILANFVASIIFLVSVMAAIYLLYNLLSSAYKRSINKNEELTDLKNSIEARNSILKQYNSAMLELTRSPIMEDNLNVVLAKVADVARDVLSLPRVSIWLFSEDKQRLIKKYLIEMGTVDTSEIELHRGDYPKYFHAVENQPVIMAPLAASHPDTSEFAKSYLEPLNIKSMLDCPIVQDKSVIGVICCEQQKFVRNWVAEDALIIQSLADFIAMHFKNQQIKTLMTQLKEQNTELSLKGEEIAGMYSELHDLNEKLVETNSNLEETVRKRTKELLVQNNQLKEYAFVNSHMLRAPLSSILGLSNLLQMKSKEMEDQELVAALFQSTKSLDQVVKKISSTLEDGSNLTRKDIDYIINERFKESEKD